MDAVFVSIATKRVGSAGGKWRVPGSKVNKHQRSHTAWDLGRAHEMLTKTDWPRTSEKVETFLEMCVCNQSNSTLARAFRGLPRPLQDMTTFFSTDQGTAFEVAFISGQPMRAVSKRQETCNAKSNVCRELRDMGQLVSVVSWVSMVFKHLWICGLCNQNGFAVCNSWENLLIATHRSVPAAEKCRSRSVWHFLCCTLDLIQKENVFYVARVHGA